MKGYINNIDFINCEAMKYWSFPKNYKKDVKQEVYNLIMSGDYWGSLKVDGYYERLIKDEDGECFMIARSTNVNGEAVNKIDWVPQLKEWMEHLPNGTCLLSECFLPGNEGSKKITSLLGCLKDKCIARQHSEFGMLSFYIFDVYAWGGKTFLEEPITTRIRALYDMGLTYLSNPYIHWAEYFNGAELWSALQGYLADDREGMVITRKDCPVFFKRTPARMTIKVKKEIRDDIDCYFTGKIKPPAKKYTGKEIESWQYWIDTRLDKCLPLKNYYKEYTEGKTVEPVTKVYYYSWAGSLEIAVLKDGEDYPIGYLSGLSDEIKEHYLDYARKPLSVTAMEIDKVNKSLRHARFIGFRNDIKLEDCTYEKVFD